MNIVNLIVEVGGLSIFIFAAVAWLKQMGLTGKWLTLSGFAFGVVFGVSYRYAAMPLVTFADWFWAVAFGLLCGFTATGAYKGAEDLATKQTKKIVAAIQKDDLNLQTPPQ